MSIPSGWSAEHAPGWTSLSYLTHDRCGYRSPIPVDLVLDRPGMHRITSGHECEDLREQREDNERREDALKRLRADFDALRDEVTSLREQVAALTATRTGSGDLPQGHPADLGTGDQGERNSP